MFKEEPHDRKCYVLNKRTYHWEQINVWNKKEFPLFFYSNNKPMKRALKDNVINSRIIGEAEY